MPFVKLVKNKAYFKRFQTKYRRRREGKTDYYARRKLVVQAKNKYNTPRYRMVVRSSNRFITCQIVYSEINCDKVICQASSSELPRYGMSAGLKSYAGAYMTGLLVARRVLAKLGLDKTYEGNTEITGEVVTTEYNDRTHFVEEVDDEKKPFRCVLDIGLVATTVGNRVFGALKGAVDGGLDIPHNEKNFPGYDKENKEYEAGEHRLKIFNLHVAEYMEAMKEEDEENGAEDYTRQFGAYERNGFDHENMEEKVEEVHEAIRADPSPKHALSAKERKKTAKFTYNPKFANTKSISLAQRKARVAQKKAHYAAQDEE